MTLPVERTWAVINTDEWLRELLRDRKPFTKRRIRATARQLLKHYPSTFDLEDPAKAFDAVVPAPGFWLAQPKIEGQINNLQERPKLASTI